VFAHLVMALVFKTSGGFEQSSQWIRFPYTPAFSTFCPVQLLECCQLPFRDDNLRCHPWHSGSPIVHNIGLWEILAMYPASSPPESQAKEILQLRQQFKMSQGIFAKLINVSTKTVQSWEQGKRKPSQASLRLLQILAVNPQTVFEIVGFEKENRG
jgi:DNA-binding XRE family transcriptional regulator